MSANPEGVQTRSKSSMQNAANAAAEDALLDLRMAQGAKFLLDVMFSDKFAQPVNVAVAKSSEDPQEKIAAK